MLTPYTLITLLMSIASRRALISFLLGVLLFAAPFAYAQTSVDVAAETEVRTNLQLPQRPLDALRLRAQQVKESALQGNLQLQIDAGVNRQNPDARGASSTGQRMQLKALIRWHGGLIKERFVLAIRHFNNILTRIDTRLGKLEDQGVDVSAVAKLKVDAELAVDKAEADAKAVADFVASIEDSDDRAAARAELGAKIKTAQASIKAAHQAIQKVVRALVALKPKVDVNATTSASVSN